MYGEIEIIVLGRHDDDDTLNGMDMDMNILGYLSLPPPLSLSLSLCVCVCVSLVIWTVEAKAGEIVSETLKSCKYRYYICGVLQHF